MLVVQQQQQQQIVGCNSDNKLVALKAKTGCEADKAKISLHHGEHNADNIHQSREDPIDQKNKLTHSRLIQHCLFRKSCYRLGTIPCTTPSVKLELRIQEPCCKM
ncbi:unnamed protein product [Sphagnum troendelagicum]|uniref:Uncharacterized protein n=1 Tax=Sphagnum troendelagicum TaxID=128251 RepID=A0ABP0U5J7_9BRYO